MPGPFVGQINSLMDMVQQPQQPAAAPPRQYGSWDQDQAYYMQPSPPLYSGGGVSGIGGGGIGAFSPPQDLARYFSDGANPRIDDPRQVAADAGISVSQLASSILPRYNKGDGPEGQGYEFPSDKGGFYRTEDVFALSGTPAQRPVMGMMDPYNPARNVQTYREGAIPVPQIATYNQQRPSTNNWRLLGMGPGWIMRNGFLINTQDPGGRQGFWAGGWRNMGNSGEQSIPGGVGIALGTGAAAGVPNMYQPGLGMGIAYGWPGATSWIGGGQPST